MEKLLPPLGAHRLFQGNMTRTEKCAVHFWNIRIILFFQNCREIKLSRVKFWGDYLQIQGHFESVLQAMKEFSDSCLNLELSGGSTRSCPGIRHKRNDQNMFPDVRATSHSPKSKIRSHNILLSVRSCPLGNINMDGASVSSWGWSHPWGFLHLNPL